MTTATISQIAAALKLTRAAVYKRAEQWPPVNESGVSQYDIDTLQLRAGEVKKIRAFLDRHHCKIIPIHPTDKAAAAAEQERQRREARAQGLELYSRLPAWQREGAAAKLAVIQAADRFVVDNKLARTHGQDVFCHEYNLGRANVAPQVRAEIRTIHPGTLRSWISAEFEQGMMGLVDMYGNRKGQSKIESYITGLDANKQPIKPMVTTILALIAHYPHIKPKRLAEYLPERCPDAPYVSAKSIERWIDAWKKEHPQEWDYLLNPDQWKNKHLTAAGQMDEHIRYMVNARWEIDATPADLLLTDGRYKIIGLIDVGTRRLIYQVTPTEKGLDNAKVVRSGILQWGVPTAGVFITDQGNPYKSEIFRRFLRDLDIEHEFCEAFSGDRKPFIERSFRTFSHDLVELLPGYIGHSVADRKAIEARKSFAHRLMKKGEVIEAKITAADLQRFCDRWIASYHDSVHGTLGKSPNQVVAAWPHSVHRITDERALDVLLSPVVGKDGWRQVGKKGIKTPLGYYNLPEFGNLSGQKVHALETEDIGRLIIYRRNEYDVMEFVGIAENPDITGISRTEVAVATRERQKETIARVNELKKELKKELKGEDVAATIMGRRERQQAERERNVIHMPRPTLEYTTPGLLAAGDAARALAGEHRPSAPVISPEVIAKKEELKAAAAQAGVLGVASIKVESARAKYARFKALREQVEIGEHIGTDAYTALEQYERSIEFKVQKSMEQDAQKAMK